MEVCDEEAEIRRVQELEKDEPLLQENPRRFVLFPIQHPDIWRFYKKAEGTRYGRIESMIDACVFSRNGTVLTWRQFFNDYI